MPCDVPAVCQSDPPLQGETPDPSPGRVRVALDPADAVQKRMLHQPLGRLAGSGEARDPAVEHLAYTIAGHQDKDHLQRFKNVLYDLDTGAGYDVLITGGDVTLRAGTRVELGDGFSVASGGSLRLVIAPVTNCP